MKCSEVKAVHCTGAAPVKQRLQHLQISGKLSVLTETNLPDVALPVILAEPM
jgi:hypothetical protein